jgi:hypothetical protein
MTQDFQPAKTRIATYYEKCSGLAATDEHGTRRRKKKPKRFQ